jgi:hypothetical protein
MKEKLLSFPFIFFSELGLSNGLWAKKIEKFGGAFHSRRRLCSAASKACFSLLSQARGISPRLNPTNSNL